MRFSPGFSFKITPNAMFFVARCFGRANYIWYLKDPDAVTGIFSCDYSQFQ